MTTPSAPENQARRCRVPPIITAIIYLFASIYALNLLGMIPPLYYVLDICDDGWSSPCMTLASFNGEQWWLIMAGILNFMILGAALSLIVGLCMLCTCIADGSCSRECAKCTCTAPSCTEEDCSACSPYEPIA